jgi:diketogulonate reductase-like aldo/keto reductase
MNAASTLPLHTGNKIPVIGLGTWKLTQDTAEVVVKAIEHGFRMIDTSGDYGTQPGIREALKKSVIPREELFIVTKVEDTDADTYETTRKNLEELGLDYVNLVLIHRPPKKGVGLELWQGLQRAKKEGLTKDIGVSNYRIEQLQELIDASGEVPVVNQIEWTPFGHSEEMLDFCRQKNILIQAYSSLTHAKRLDDPTLTEIATGYHKSPAQLLLRWNVQLGTVPLTKTDKLDEIKQNIDIFDFEISADDMATLNGLNEDYSIFGELIYV